MNAMDWYGRVCLNDLAEDELKRDVHSTIDKDEEKSRRSGRPSSEENNGEFGVVFILKVGFLPSVRTEAKGPV